MLRFAPLLLIVLHRGQDASLKEDFRKAIDRQVYREVVRTCKALVERNTKEDATLITNALDRTKLDPDIRTHLIRSAVSFSDAAALAEVARYALVKPTGAAARDLVAALSANNHAPVEGALLQILRGRDEDLTVLALERLAEVGGKEAVAEIIKLLKETKSTELSALACRVLPELVQENYGESASNWIGWWEANTNKAWSELERKKAKASKGGLLRSQAITALQKDPKRVLLVRSGTHCKCKREHDFDTRLSDQLSAMDVPFSVLTRGQLDAAAGKLDDGSVVRLADYSVLILIAAQIGEHCACPTCRPQENSTAKSRIGVCTGCDKHETARYFLNKPALDKIKGFVDRGGTVVTFDWGIQEVLEIQWPKLIKAGAKLKTQEAPSFPSPGALAHPYLRRVFDEKTSESPYAIDFAMEPVLDHDAYAIQILNAKRVRPLITSPTIGAQSDKAGSPAIAVVISPDADFPAEEPQLRSKRKGGRIVHFVPYLSNQKGRTLEVLTGILVNVILDATSAPK